MPAWIDVRKDTYGIFLSHPIVASCTRGAIDLVTGLSRTQPSLFQRLPDLIHNPYARMSLVLLWFIFVYMLALLITKALRGTRFSWVVGVRERARGVIPTVKPSV